MLDANEGCGCFKPGCVNCPDTSTWGPEPVTVHGFTVGTTFESAGGNVDWAPAGTPVYEILAGDVDIVTFDYPSHRPRTHARLSVRTWSYGEWARWPRIINVDQLERQRLDGWIRSRG